MVRGWQNRGGRQVLGFGMFWTGKRQSAPVTMASAVREQHGFSVVVGERVIEPGLDDRGRWRIGTFALSRFRSIIGTGRTFARPAE